MVASDVQYSNWHRTRADAAQGKRLTAELQSIQILYSEVFKNLNTLDSSRAISSGAY